jgi:hypothetical protein
MLLQCQQHPRGQSLLSCAKPPAAATKANEFNLDAVTSGIPKFHVHALLPGTLLSCHNSTVMLVNLLTCSSCANVHRATPTSCGGLHNAALLQLTADLLHGGHALGVAMRRSRRVGDACGRTRVNRAWSQRR